MIIDFHTHIFPPEIRNQRAEYVEREPTFAEMYEAPKAKIATAEDLAESMMSSGVDISVALGFAWNDHSLIVRHNDYLLETMMRGEGRIIPFCTVNMLEPGAESEIERVAREGARGLGELRPESQGWELNSDAGERLAALARQYNLILLFHVTEPNGHLYRGKYGLSLSSFVRFAAAHPDLTVIGAHLGGGLPLFLKLDQRQAVSHVIIDTAARGYLYTPEEYNLALHRVTPGNVVFGSDFPLVPQSRDIAALKADTEDADALAAVLGGTAARVLGIKE